MKRIKIILTLTLTLVVLPAFSQAGLVQIIKGIVRDKESQSPLPGATVAIVNSNPTVGANTDADGQFRLSNVPVGRQNLQVYLMGYEPFVVRELLVGSGKEVVLNIELREMAIGLSEVRIKANSNKEAPINTMATTSARQLSVEEANRYAGGFDDPARLVSAFAGVAGGLQNNGVVIRGNSPQGMLWRMEGVEISNPTHFANLTTFGGGGITALSSQMLANSDFYTGAFPAEYGNALSGVFDLKLRNGNSEKREYTFQVGVIGLDFAAEGPLGKNHKASFLFNYRYSTFSLLGPVLPASAGGIRYQDLNFKINLLTRKTGTFSLWGIGALDKNPQKALTDSSLWEYNQDKEEANNNLTMGALGINNKLILSPKSFLFTSISASGNGLAHRQGRLSNTMVLEPTEHVDYQSWKYSFASYLNHKFSTRHTNRSGIIIDDLNYNYNIQNATVPGEPLAQKVKSRSSSFLMQVYSESRIDLIERININVGLHAQRFALNGNSTLEPRAGITWRMAPGHSLSFAYGNHSQLAPLQIYLVQNTTAQTMPNKNLDFSKAHHFVIGYDWNINDNMRLKIEPYYQILYHIPVKPRSSYSLLNLDHDWFFSDSLVNKGKGHNVGVDFTLERFLNHGYYYLITASVFESKYKGGDGVERNTRYNKHYVWNILGGKEWTFRNSNMLSVNGRLNVMGGDRISPLDMQSSLASKEAVYNENLAFADSKPAVCYVDFTINYKINRQHHSSTWSLKLINALGAKESYGYRYNYRTRTMELEQDALLVPNFSYKVEF
jgi:hypothetical protein